ncbi:MAG: class I SAM-dependent rRNA methyltransferase [Burkholderiales bacterium]|nr:class I SAM-dependent rRNA methyltransferase [Burkholderiales bacterium]
MSRLVLKPGREKSLQRHHPWIFSGAVGRVEGDPQPGDTVEVRTALGGFAAWAAWSPKSQISARVWDWHESQAIDDGFITERVRAAVDHRRRQFGFDEPRAALRLLHGEADGLPGVVADRYGRLLVLQLSSAGAWRWRDTIAAALREVTGLDIVFERSDADVLTLEGLEPRVGPLRGKAPEGSIEIEEAGLVFEVDPVQGHKTGFYLDQRDNRALLRGLSDGRSVLDCFSYSGGFALNALAGGASRVTAVDSSADALAAAQRHVGRNRLAADRVELLEADVFKQLRRFRDENRHFDIIVLDPPKFAPTAAHAEKAARAYKDINLWAFKLLSPGGLLFTFSCSGGVHRDLFQKIVAGAAADAGVDARVLHHLAAAPDHPVSLRFPEGEYLKGLVLEQAP